MTPFRVHPLVAVVAVFSAALIASAVPADSLFPQQWGLDNTGQSVNGALGVPGADAQWLEAFTSELFPNSNANPITVAVIDTGVDASHPDLAGVCLPGANFSFCMDVPTDVDGHGTQVASVIGAVHNDIGIAGAAPGVQILPVKALCSLEFFVYDYQLADSIRYAADNGARVINMSLGLPFDSTTFRSAVQYASDRGCVIVASTGNTPTEPIGYPARYSGTIDTPDIPGVIAVAGTLIDDTVWIAGTCGPETDVAAPCRDIITASLNESYAYETGTSFAAPLVSALAAVILQVNPDLTPAEVKSIITESATDIPVPGDRTRFEPCDTIPEDPATGWDPFSGYGRIDFVQALALAQATVACPADWNKDGIVAVSDVLDFLNAWGSSDPAADITGDGLFTTSDVLEFLGLWSQSC